MQAQDVAAASAHVSACLQPASAVRVLEKTTAPPTLPHIIADYLGDGVHLPWCLRRLFKSHLGPCDANLLDPASLQRLKTPSCVSAHLLGTGTGGRGIRLPDRDQALPRRSTLSASLHVSAGQKGGAAAVAGSPSPPAPSPCERRVLLPSTMHTLLATL